MLKRAALGENVAGTWGGSGSEEQQRRDWTQAGWRILAPAIADVESGIAHVYGLIKPLQLRVFRTCTGLLDELGTYAREVGDDGQATEKIKNQSDFHCLDALRYVGQWLTQHNVSLPPGRQPVDARPETAGLLSRTY
mgnify:CR=1 FL=1